MIVIPGLKPLGLLVMTSEKVEDTITIAVDPGELLIMRLELPWRQSVAVIYIKPAEPDGRIPSELGLADEAIAIGIGGIERQALIEPGCAIALGLLGSSRTDRAEHHRDRDICCCRE